LEKKHINVTPSPFRQRPIEAATLQRKMTLTLSGRKKSNKLAKVGNPILFEQKKPGKTSMFELT